MRSMFRSDDETKTAETQWGVGSGKRERASLVSPEMSLEKLGQGSAAFSLDPISVDAEYRVIRQDLHCMYRAEQKKRRLGCVKLLPGHLVLSKTTALFCSSLYVI